MTVMPILMRSEALISPVHIVYLILLLVFLCELLELGMACHDMASLPPFIQRRQALFSNHLKSLQIGPQTRRVPPVTFLVDWDYGMYSWH